MHSTQFPSRRLSTCPLSLYAGRWINYEWSHHLSKHVKFLSVDNSSSPLCTLMCQKRSGNAKSSQQNDEKLPIKLLQLELIVPINIVFPMHTDDDDDSLRLGLPLCNMCEIAMRFFSLLLQMHVVSVHDAPFIGWWETRRGKTLATCGVPSKSAFENSHKCILHTFAGNNRKKN